MLVVGLTGGIGSGKTTVSDLFAELGINIIDTDVIARQLINEDPSILNKLAETFGRQVATPNGILNRKKLASIVFSDSKKKQQLENILHPIIRSKVKTEIQKLMSADTVPAYVIVVVPLLFEAGFDDITDRIVVVMSDKNNRINRILQRDHRSPDEIQSIINSQVSDEIRVRNADDIINNDGNIEDLKPQILHLHNIYTSPATDVG